MQVILDQQPNHILCSRCSSNYRYDNYDSYDNKNSSNISNNNNTMRCTSPTAYITTVV